MRLSSKKLALLKCFSWVARYELPLPHGSGNVLLSVPGAQALHRPVEIATESGHTCAGSFVGSKDGIAVIPTPF